MVHCEGVSVCACVRVCVCVCEGGNGDAELFSIAIINSTCSYLVLGYREDDPLVDLPCQHIHPD